MAECQQKQQALGENATEKHAFYQSVIDALEGVLFYANAWADYALEVSQTFPADDPRAINMRTVSARLREFPARPPVTFLDALQSIHLLHCALHWTGEIVPIGRLDQLLYPYYQQDIANNTITPQLAQEALDCFWIKLDEKVVQNRRFFIEDRFTSSDGAPARQLWSQ